MTRSFAPLLFCLLAAALFGASTPAAKWLLGGMHPVWLSALLYLGAGLAVAPWALRDRQAFRRLDRRSCLVLAGVVVSGGLIGPLCLLLGLRLAGAASVALWLSLETVATALFARVFFAEHLHTASWGAVALTVLASALLSGGRPEAGVALLLVAVACAAWGLDNNLTAILGALGAAQITFVKGVAAGLVYAVIGASTLDSVPSISRVGVALGVGAVGYGVSLLFYTGGAHQLGATRSQLVFATAPAWGIALAWSWLGEPVHGVELVAIALLALAIWLFHRERHGHEHAHEWLAHRHWHRHDDGHHDHAHPEGEGPSGWHSHEHEHEPRVHAHPHEPDLHHRHKH